MTEDEFNQQVAAGNVADVTPPADQSPPLDSPPPEGEPVLSAMRRPRRALTAAPTNTPKTFADSIQYVDDGTTKSLYVYFSGAWQQIPIGGSFFQPLKSVTLGSAGAKLDTTTFTAKKFLYIEIYIPTPAAGIMPSLQFNADTGNNYAWQVFNPNAGASSGAQPQAQLVDNNNVTTGFFFSGNIINIASDYKELTGQSKPTSSGISRVYTVWDAWSNNSVQITSIQLLDSGGANLPVGTLINVFGHD